MIHGKRSFLANMIFYSKLYKGLRKVEKPSLVIFNYHRISKAGQQPTRRFDEGVFGPTQEEFLQQMRWLKKNSEIISENDLIAHVQDKNKLPHSAVMVTFDDGYRDNSELALPILQELKIPAIFFIATRAIEKRELGWWDTIAYLIKKTKQRELVLRDHLFDLTLPKEPVIQELQTWMRTQRSDATRFLIKEISNACKVPLPESDLCSNELMSWQQIKEAQEAGITIGSHTHTHRVLSTLSPEDQEEEFRISKQILENELGKTVRSIAYPVGSQCDYIAETAVIAKRSGYELGFSFQTGANKLAQIKQFEVARISGEESIPLTCAAITLPSVFARSRSQHFQHRQKENQENLNASILKARKKINAEEKTMNKFSLIKDSTTSTMLSILISMLILGPVQPAFARDHTKTEDEDASMIAPGYKLKLSSSEDSKLNGEFRVSYEGTVPLPYDISMSAAGMRVKAFQAAIEKKYEPYFKGKPRIGVSITQKQYAVKILGVVKNPGPYLLKERSTLDEALAMAQVRTEDLSGGFARIIHGKQSRTIAMEDYLKGGRAHDLPAWKGGEQIIFQMDRPENDAADADDETKPGSRKVLVYGEVKNPGSTSFQRNADGYYYLIQKGGPTRDSDLGRVELLRKDPKTNQHKRITIGDLADIKDIQDSDVMLVYPDRPSSFERTLQTTGVIAAIISSIALTVLVVRQ